MVEAEGDGQVMNGDVDKLTAEIKKQSIEDGKQTIPRSVMNIHYSKKLKEHDQHHLWYVDTLRSSC